MTEIRLFLTKLWISFLRKIFRAIPVIFYLGYLSFKYTKLRAILDTVPGALSLIDAYYIEKDFISASNRAKIALEFGAFKGRSTVILSHIAQKKKAKLFTFERFRGLPKTTKYDVMFKKGEYCASYNEFKKNLSKKGVPGVVKLITGDIRKTMGKIPNSFDYAFVDVDLYGITKIILQKLLRIARGGEIIDVHDNNHSPGVRRAIQESIKNCTLKVQMKTFPLSLITQIRVL